MSLSPTSSANAQAQRLAIGTYTKDPKGGIVVAPFDTINGSAQTATVAVPTPNPSFLAWHPTGRFVYAANENGTFDGHPGGGASAFRLDAETQHLTPLNSVSIPGGPCHLAVDATGKFLFVVTYGGGNLSVWKLSEDGHIGERVAFVQHEGKGADPKRQSAPHAHHVVLSPDNRFAFVADLGLDKVLVYGFNAQKGTLSSEPVRSLALKPGAGPRHMVFEPNGHFLYVINELDNTIAVFRFAEDEAIQTLSTLPEAFEGTSHTAEIAVHPNGQFLYGSNRGHDSIVTFQIDGDSGQLKCVGHTPTEGRNPRHFALDSSGRWLFVANQNDRNVVVFRVDPNTGALSKTSVLSDVPGEPTYVALFPISR